MNDIIYLISMILGYFIVGLIGNLLSIETSEEQSFFVKYLKKYKNPLFYLLILYTIFSLKNSIFNLILYIFLIILFHVLVLKLKINLIVPSTIISYSFAFILRDYYGIIFNLIYIMFYYTYMTSKNLLSYAKKKKIKLETDTKFKGYYLKLLLNNFKIFKIYYVFFIFSVFLFFI